MINKVHGTEAQILSGVKDGSLYGYLVADVETPTDVLEKILWLNFPPIFQRNTVDESMLSPYMKERAKG